MKDTRDPQTTLEFECWYMYIGLMDRCGVRKMSTQALSWLL